MTSGSDAGHTMAAATTAAPAMQAIVRNRQSSAMELATIDSFRRRGSREFQIDESPTPAGDQKVQPGFCTASRSSSIFSASVRVKKLFRNSS